MRVRLPAMLLLITLATLASVFTFPWAPAQNPPQPLPTALPAVDVIQPVPKSNAIQPVTADGTAVTPKQVAKARRVPFDRFRNLEALSPPNRQMVMTTLMGMEWLHRYNQPNGLFLHGYVPALNQTMEGDHFLHQARAAFALARSAKFTGDERFSARAQQSVLTLLTMTSIDPATGVRRPAQPSLVCSRLQAAGLLAMTIFELPDAAADLTTKGEEIVAFIRQMQAADGSLTYIDAPGELIDPDGINQHPGPALYALAMSHRQRPTAQKADTLRKAATYYRKWFREHADPEFIPWMTAACVEAYAGSREGVYAEFAMEMNDWLCGMQYADAPDPRRLHWRGGFKSFSKGKIESTAPEIETAMYAQSLADSCRLIRMMQTPDLQRYDRYRTALLRSLQFVGSLQYTESNTLHFSDPYRPKLVGGFHPNHADGNLRIDQSAMAVSAFVQFLSSGADRSE